MAISAVRWRASADEDASCISLHPELEANVFVVRVAEERCGGSRLSSSSMRPEQPALSSHNLPTLYLVVTLSVGVTLKHKKSFKSVIGHFPRPMVAQAGKAAAGKAVASRKAATAEKAVTAAPPGRRGGDPSTALLGEAHRIFEKFATIPNAKKRDVKRAGKPALTMPMLIDLFAFMQEEQRVRFSDKRKMQAFVQEKFAEYDVLPLSLKPCGSVRLYRARRVLARRGP